MSIKNRLDKLEGHQTTCSDPDCAAGRRWTIQRDDGDESTTDIPQRIAPICPVCGKTAGIIRVVREAA